MPHTSHAAYTYSSFLAGLLLAIAFAPFDVGYLAVIALSFLFWSWEAVSPSKAAWRGYLFGLGLFGFGASWVYVSVHDYGGASAIGSGLLTAFFVAFWALFPALVGYLAVKIRFGSRTVLNILWAPLIWILVENIRGYWLLNGFPWLQIAYAEIDTPLGGYIPILGVYGTGFLLALSASLMVFMLKHHYKTRLLIGLLTAIWVGGGLLKTITWTQVIGAPFKVSLIQGNIPQDQKWVPENKISTLLKYKQLTEAHWDSKVIIWPESAIPAYLSQVDEHFVTPLEAEAKEHNVDIIVSLPLQEADAIYNGVLSLGAERMTYKKNHLLPFGEYLALQPLSGWVLDLLGIKLGDFTSGGASQPFLKAGGYAFSTSICYEDAFGGEVINRIEQAAFLVNVTNDAWFGNSLEPHQHLQIARMRALETGRYLLRATNTGVTAIVDARGKVIKQAPLFETAVLTDLVMPMGGVTPYAKIGDALIIGVLTLLLIGLMLIKWYRQKSN
ncbi:MAG: apolipoprotein N-acyltransferase [Methylococcaceae bacterium]|nr:apolipoprotein N-acyltransferase [Methylococcaceae bacterium]